jgi:hypothetical protein
VPGATSWKMPKRKTRVEDSDDDVRIFEKKARLADSDDEIPLFGPNGLAEKLDLAKRFANRRRSRRVNSLWLPKIISNKRWVSHMRN